MNPEILVLDLDIRTLLPPNSTHVTDLFGCEMTSLVTLDLSTLPIEEIGSGCFNGAGSLLELKLSKTMKTIGPGSFCGLKKLTTLTFPESLEYISADCFSDCSNLKRLVFKGPTKVDPKAFKRCKHPDLVFDRQWGGPKINPETPFLFPFHSGRIDNMGPYLSDEQRFDNEAKCEITGNKFVYGMHVIILPCGHVFSVLGMLNRYDEGHRTCFTCNFVLQ